MEFFEWLFVPNFIVTMLAFYDVRVSDKVYYIITLGICAALYLVCLVIGGLGLSRMAKFAGIGNRWMAFVPFLNTYYAQKLGGEASVFGAKMKRAGLYAMLIEIVYFLLNVFILVLTIYLAQDAFYSQVVSDIEGEGAGTMSYEFDLNRVPANMRWAYYMTNSTGFGVLDIVNSLVGLALVFFFCVLYNSVYKKYYIRSPFLLTFLSAVLPGRAFCLYAVRNNAPVDYDAYVKKMREAAARRAQQGPYGGAGPGGAGGPYGGPASGPQEPFSDFSGPNTGSSGGSGSDIAGGSGNSGGNDSPFSDF